MSRKKGSKNSLAKGLDWTVRVCTTLIVTTEGPTRSAAATIEVRLETLGSRLESAPCATATVGRRSPRPGVRLNEAAPTTSAPRRRNPHTTPQSQVLRNRLLS